MSLHIPPITPYFLGTLKLPGWSETPLGCGRCLRAKLLASSPTVASDGNQVHPGRLTWFTYKSPIWKGNWSEPNLHQDMVQPLIFPLETHPKSQKNLSKARCSYSSGPSWAPAWTFSKNFYSHLSSSPESPTKKKGSKMSKSLRLTESWQQQNRGLDMKTWMIPCFLEKRWALRTQYLP